MTNSKDESDPRSHQPDAGRRCHWQICDRRRGWRDILSRTGGNLDIDIFVSFQSAGPLINLSPIYEYLTTRGFKAEKEYVIIGDWPVQFLPAANALLEEALAQAVGTELEGVPTWVMTAEHLTAIALQTGRTKDFNRILQFVESGTLAPDRFDSILKQHGLLAKWEQFGDKFLKGSS